MQYEFGSKFVSLSLPNVFIIIMGLHLVLNYLVYSILFHHQINQLQIAPMDCMD
jgi:hypothetical protein